MKRLDKLLCGKLGGGRRRSRLDEASETCASDRERRNALVRRMRARREGGGTLPRDRRGQQQAAGWERRWASWSRR